MKKMNLSKVAFILFVSFLMVPIAFCAEPPKASGKTLKTPPLSPAMLEQKKFWEDEQAYMKQEMAYRKEASDRMVQISRQLGDFAKQLKATTDEGEKKKIQTQFDALRQEQFVVGEEMAKHDVESAEHGIVSAQRRLELAQKRLEDIQARRAQKSNS